MDVLKECFRELLVERIEKSLNRHIDAQLADKALESFRDEVKKMLLKKGEKLTRAEMIEAMEDAISKEAFDKMDSALKELVDEFVKQFVKEQKDIE